MRHLIWIVLASAMVVALLIGRSASQERARKPDPTIQAFMRAKLTHSQTLLEALATEDFPKLAKNAHEINKLTLDENWQVLQTMEYAQHSLEFRRTANALTDAAKKKNIDAAALAYVDMTMKCVNCHKYVRDSRIARQDSPLPGAASSLGN